MSHAAYDIHADHEPVGRKICQVNEAARELFLEQGFAATSMDAIARAASVSKATLYSYFVSKEALFEYLITEECAVFNGALVLPTIAEGFDSALRRFAAQYVHMFLTAKKHSLFRVMASESSRFPELCLRFYEAGPLATVRGIAQFLLEARDKGLVAFADEMTAATHFLSLIRGDLPLQTVLGVQLLTAAKMEQDINAGIETFLRAYGVPRAAAA